MNGKLIFFPDSLLPFLPHPASSSDRSLVPGDDSKPALNAGPPFDLSSLTACPSLHNAMHRHDDDDGRFGDRKFA